MRVLRLFIMCSTLAWVAVSSAYAQVPAPFINPTKDASEISKTDPPVEVSAPDTGKPAPTNKLWPTSFSRWFEVQSATLGLRYRMLENSLHEVTANHVQHQESFRARFKFDAQGRYSINALVSTGNQFRLSWANTGLGTGNATNNLYLKHLYLSAQLVKGIEFQYGSIPVARGETTEITGYDNDGYLTGERVTIRRPQQLFFDEVAITYAYLGDFTQPGANKRFHRLTQSNYHQFLVTKKIGERTAITADYTFHNGAETLRQAIKTKMPELRVVDSIRFENYERLVSKGAKPGYGFVVAGEKKVTNRLTLNGGYAQIDPVAGALNADRLGRGKRIYLTSTYALTPELSVSTFVTRAIGNNPGVPNRIQCEVLLSYDLLKGLKRAHIF